MHFFRYRRGGPGRLGVLGDRTNHASRGRRVNPRRGRRSGTRANTCTSAASFVRTCCRRVHKSTSTGSHPSPAQGSLSAWTELPRSRGRTRRGCPDPAPLRQGRHGSDASGWAHSHSPGHRGGRQEVELAAVIGQTAYLVAADAPADVAGYTVSNEAVLVTPSSPTGSGIGARASTPSPPMGSVLTEGDGFDPNGADVATRVDGVKM